jgi:hypothetical protein
LSETLHILRRGEGDIIINEYRLSCEVPIILVIFEPNLSFLTEFRKYSNMEYHEYPFIGSRIVACRMMEGWTDERTDRQTAMTKLVAVFRNFAKALKTLTSDSTRLAVTTHKSDKYPMLHVQFLSS